MRANDYARGASTRSWDSFSGDCEKNTGYYIEADIPFSDKCKQALTDFPPTPKHTNVKFSELSQFAQNSFVNTHGKKEMYQK